MENTSSNYSMIVHREEVTLTPVEDKLFKVFKEVLPLF
jgi:hypothetical protein